MKFQYNSLRFGRKELPQKVVSEMWEYLSTTMKDGMSCGDIQDLMLAFRRSNGERLMIHQLAPMFEYVAVFGHLWDEVAALAAQQKEAGRE